LSLDPLALALKKQRLLLESARLRAQWCTHVDNLRPALTGVDRVGQGLRWLRERPQVAVAAVGLVVGVFLTRPRIAMRWGRRAWLAWQMWRRARTWLAISRPF
jgi:hypothetical protein